MNHKSAGNALLTCLTVFLASAVIAMPAESMPRRRAVRPPKERLEIFTNASDSRLAPVSVPTIGSTVTIYGTKPTNGRSVRYDFSVNPVRLVITTADGTEYEVANGAVRKLTSDSSATAVTATSVDAHAIDVTPEASAGTLSGTVVRVCDGASKPVAGAEVSGVFRLRGDVVCPTPTFATVTDSDGRFSIQAPATAATSDMFTHLCDSLPSVADAVCEWVPPDIDLEKHILAACPAFLLVPPPEGEALASLCLRSVGAWTAMCKLKDGCEHYETLATDYYSSHCFTDNVTATVVASHPDFGTASSSFVPVPSAVTLTLPKPNCESTKERYFASGVVTNSGEWSRATICNGISRTAGAPDRYDSNWTEFSVGKKLRGEWVRGTCSYEERTPGRVYINVITYDYPNFFQRLEEHRTSDGGTDDVVRTIQVFVPNGSMRGSFASKSSGTTPCEDRSVGVNTETQSYSQQATFTIRKASEEIAPTLPESPLTNVCTPPSIWTPF